MHFVDAFVMVGEDLDDPTVMDATVCAGIQHSLQFLLQRLELSNTGLDILETFPGNRVGRRTRSGRMFLKFDQGSDRIDLESQFP